MGVLELKYQGNGSAWSGHLACTEDIRRVRISYSPPNNWTYRVGRAW